MKILVVDDSSVQRKMITQLILQAGYSHDILEAENGEDAIQILGRNFKEISLIFCDWNMPKMNGLEFIQGVIKVPPVAGIPIVMVTVEGSDDKIAKARAAHPQLAGYVVKPFTPDQLKNLLNSLLKK